MRVHVDLDKCIGAGQCVLAADTTFDQQDDGIVILLKERPARDDEEAVREAAMLCPAQAILLED